MNQHASTAIDLQNSESRDPSDELTDSSAQITLDRYTHLFEDDLEGLAGSAIARYGAAQAYIGAGCGPLGEGQKGRHTKGVVTTCPRSSGDRAPVS